MAYNWNAGAIAYTEHNESFFVVRIPFVEELPRKVIVENRLRFFEKKHHVFFRSLWISPDSIRNRSYTHCMYGIADVSVWPDVAITYELQAGF